MPAKSVLTIGILAHVDAGKTSLTECLLHQAGAVNFSWKETQFQLVDTPGHIDFAAEVDRALSILDAVILVVSAKEDVQAS